MLLNVPHTIYRMLYLKWYINVLIILRSRTPSSAEFAAVAGCVGTHRSVTAANFRLEQSVRHYIYRSFWWIASYELCVLPLRFSSKLQHPTNYFAHFILSFRLFTAQSRRYKLMRVWYGIPDSSACALKYDTVSRSRRMVIGCFRYLVKGFFRPFIFEKS